MNNISYCGLTDSKMRPSDTDLPVINLLLYREGYSTVWKAIGIDTYRHIIGNSIVQKSSGMRDIATLSGGVCLPIYFDN